MREFWAVAYEFAVGTHGIGSGYVGEPDGVQHLLDYVALLFW